MMSDKATWGPGPWQTEPDRVEFKHAGLPCLLRRGPLGAWCGYVAVPPGHPCHGRATNDLDLSVHGGVTYASLCSEEVCHVPEPGEPDDVWWVGFDLSHARDYVPAMAVHATIDEHLAALLPDLARQLAELHDRRAYRDLAYARGQVEQLAEQLAELRETP